MANRPLPQYPQWQHNPDGSVETQGNYPDELLYIALQTAELQVDPVTRTGRFRVRVEPIEGG